MDIKGKLIPFGILEVPSGESTIVFGTSRETSDFIVDCLELWWQDRKALHGDIRELVINLDNGPALASNRTQFIKRITEFSDCFGRCDTAEHLRVWKNRAGFFPSARPTTCGIDVRSDSSLSMS